MKWLALCLVVFNLLIFGYFNLGLSDPTVTHVTLAPLQPEKLKILTSSEIEALPKKAVEMTAVTLQPAVEAMESKPPQCYEWGMFKSAQAKKVSMQMDKLLLQYAQKEAPIDPDGAHFWIYIPPKATLELAQAKVAELNRLGVVETFIVQEAPWKYAISFGMFKDEALADKLLIDLKKHGVKTAIKGDRNQNKDNITFYISNMTPELLGELDKIKGNYSEAELTAVTCRP